MMETQWILNYISNHPMVSLSFLVMKMVFHLLEQLLVLHLWVSKVQWFHTSLINCHAHLVYTEYVVLDPRSLSDRRRHFTLIVKHVAWYCSEWLHKVYAMLNALLCSPLLYWLKYDKILTCIFWNGIAIIILKLLGFLKLIFIFIIEHT